MNHSWDAFAEFLKEVLCNAKVCGKVEQNLVETMEGEYAKYSAFFLVGQKNTSLANLHIYEDSVGMEAFIPWAPKPDINHKRETVGWTRTKKASKWILISLLAVLCNVQY